MNIDLNFSQETYASIGKTFHLFILSFIYSFVSSVHFILFAPNFSCFLFLNMVTNNMNKASFVFTFFFAGFSLIAGSVSDKYPRNVIAIVGMNGGAIYFSVVLL